MNTQAIATVGAEVTRRRKRVIRPFPRRLKFRQYYLLLSKDERYDFCEKAGTTEGYIHQIYGGWTLGSIDVAMRIDEASNARIPAWYLRPDVFDRPAGEPVMR